jgi:putative spermidine/putrescine transport system permease protein
MASISLNTTKRSTAAIFFYNWIGVLPFLFFVLVFLIYPSINLFAGAFKDAQGNFTLANINVLKNAYVLKSYSISLQLSFITTIVGGALGFLAAYAITIGSAPRWMRSTLITFSALAANFGGVPLAFSFIATIGRTGFITAFLNQICYQNNAGMQVCPLRPYDHGFNLYGLTGLVLAYTYFLFPLMILTMTPALDNMKKEWREASGNLGASNWQYWRDIGFPILWPSILGSLLLLFGSAFGAFATAQALTGGSIYLVTILIGQQIRGDVLNNPHEGYAMALGMVFVMALTITGYTVLQRLTTRWLKS